MTRLSSRTIGLVGVFLSALLFLGPQQANAQLWLQTSRIVTPVDQGAVRVFLDTLVTVMERRGLKARRSPNQNTRMTIDELRSQLIGEEGVGLRSANHAFIDYRFTIDDGSRFEQKIAALHFVFRPGPKQSDISVLYVDAQDNWLDELLHNKGTNLRSNQAAMIPFQQHLDFAEIARQEESTIVEIGGETIREGFHEKKEDLIRKVERLSYQKYV
jgi:hypothetical protein